MLNKWTLMKLPKILNRLLIAVSISIIALIGYYGWELYAAYHYTVDSVIPMENKTSYPLTTSSLSVSQHDALLKIEDPDFYHHTGIDLSTPRRWHHDHYPGPGQKDLLRSIHTGYWKNQTDPHSPFCSRPLDAKGDATQTFHQYSLPGAECQGF